MYKDILDAARSGKGLDALSDKALLDPISRLRPNSVRWADLLLLGYVNSEQNIPERIVRSVCTNRPEGVTVVICEAVGKWNNESKFKAKDKGITNMGLSLLISLTSTNPPSTQTELNLAVVEHNEQINKILGVRESSS